MIWHRTKKQVGLYTTLRTRQLEAGETTVDKKSRGRENVKRNTENTQKRRNQEMNQDTEAQDVTVTVWVC